MARTVCRLSLALVICSGCFQSLNPSPPPGVTWDQDDRFLWHSMRGSETKHTRLFAWRMMAPMPRLILFRNSRFHFAATLENADGAYGRVECRVGEDRSEFTCTLSGNPLVAFAQHCAHGVVRYGSRSYSVEPWFGETGHHVGFVLYSERYEPLLAYDLDHQWQQRAYVRRGLDFNDQVAAETISHVLAMMWRADEETIGPCLCGELILHRRFPR